MPKKGWTKMSLDEIRLANQWHKEHVAASEIAKRLKRDKSVITRHVVKKILKKKQGRPATLTEAEADYLEKTLDEMIQKALCFRGRVGFQKELVF